MKKINGIIMTLMSISVLSFAIPHLYKENNVHAEEATTIVHKFGGENGEWETDADNSTGVWSYYTTLGTFASKQAMTLNGNQYENGEAYYQVNKSGYMHPGASGNYSCPAIGLKAEATGKLSLTLVATRSADSANVEPSTSDNGTKVFFALNDDSHVIGDVCVNRVTTTYSLTDIAITQGDEILMLVHHLLDIACDGTTYEVTYTISNNNQQQTSENESEEPSSEFSEESNSEESSSEESSSESEFVGENTKITHTFGGKNGEWEIDADNSTGMWNYYATLGTISSKEALTLDGESYKNNEIYFEINKNGFIHPGASGNFSCPAIGLIAEKDGYLSVALGTRREQASKNTDIATEDNGTKVFFALNDDTHVIGDVCITNETETYRITDVPVEQGDEIIMLIHHLLDISYDGTFYQVTYTINDYPNQQVDDPIIPDLVLPEPEQYTPVHPQDPDKPALEGKLESVNSLDGFRFYQGANGFTYLYGKADDGIEGLLPLTAEAVNWDTAGVLDYLNIRLDGLLHPGYTNEAYVVALAWTAPKDRVVDIYLDTLFETLEGNEGDGVIVSIYKNSDVLLSYPLIAKDNIYNDNEPIQARINQVDLKEGDIIYLVIDPNKNLPYDGVYCYLEISWEKQEAVDPSDKTSEQTSEGSSKPVKKGCKSATVPSALGLITLLSTLLLKKRKGE